MMNLKSHLTYTIGFFTTGIEMEYSSILAKAITSVANEYNISVVNFLGGSLNPNATFQKYKYQYQCDVAFNYAKNTHIDGIILASDILSSFLTPQDFIKFYSQFLPIPMVSLGLSTTDLPSVYTDNKGIFCELVSHVIQIHNKHNIAFISGPSSNYDALDRYAGYMQALSLNHITYNPDYVYVGDFTPDCIPQALYTLFDKRALPIDAIICSNDTMALAVIDELKKRNLRVPEDIIVTGCDDIYSATSNVPSLTSISQSPELFAKEAILTILDCIEGKKPANKSIPSHIIYRESCGCQMVPEISHSELMYDYNDSQDIEKIAKTFLSYPSFCLSSELIEEMLPIVTICYSKVLEPDNHYNDADTIINAFNTIISNRPLSLPDALNLNNCFSSLKKDLLKSCMDIEATRYIENVLSCMIHILFSEILKHYSTHTHHLTNNFSFSRHFLLTITNHIHATSNHLDFIVPDLIECGVKSCLIYLYPNEIIHNLSDCWQTPDTLELNMAFIDGKIVNLPTPLPALPASEVATHMLASRNKVYSSYVHSLFFGNEQLGMIVLEVLPEDYSLIENLTVELGCAIKLASVFFNQRQTKSKLETLSQTDELTNLLNRRGFFMHAESRYTAMQANKESGFLFYADMDGLKTINDTFGHHEGDLAIIAMSTILKEAFNENPILARIGGDEFVILCSKSNQNFCDEQKTLIQKLCDDYNQSSKKPYTLSISLGAIYFDASTPNTLESLMSKADHLLYKEKKLKKSKKATLISKKSPQN